MSGKRSEKIIHAGICLVARPGAAVKLGIATVITDEGIRPEVLAKALGDGEFDSLHVAENSHPGKSGHAVPGAWRVLLVLRRIRRSDSDRTRDVQACDWGPGVLPLPQWDPIRSAKAVSSLDQISGGGRLPLGLGLGWNLEEAADHGVEATMRGKLLDEKLAAM